MIAPPGEPRRVAYLYLLPALLAFGAFVLFPLLHAAWKKLNESEGLVPYLDYSTPDFYDQITAAIQRLLAGKDSPQKFAQGVQADYARFTKTL